MVASLWAQHPVPHRRFDTVRHREIAPVRSPIRELHADLDALLKNRDLASAFIGVCILSTETGEFLYRFNDTKAFVPASLVKLITTAAAFELLGPDFRFTTRVYLDGRLRQGGDFEGNIIIRGSGDPSWSEAFGTWPDSVFAQWCTGLDSLGITTVRGNIIADDSYFDAVRYGPGWMWDDFGMPYSPPISALAAHDNCMRLQLQPGTVPGAPVSVRVLRGSSHARINSELITAPSDALVDVVPVREYGTGTIELIGSVPLANDTATGAVDIEVPVDNPAAYVGALFREFLNRRGIRVRGSVLTASEWGEPIPYNRLPVVGGYTSLPLRTLVTVMNHTSHNLCAEMLLKTIGKESSGSGSFESGIEYIRSMIQRNGLPSDDIQLSDGSGLSRLNLCTPVFFARLLWYLWRSRWRNDFVASLARPGDYGTLRTRLVGTLAEKSVVAKTGTLNNVSNLAGYVTTRDGEVLCVVVMVNHLLAPESIARNLQDLICMRLASFSRR
ncbi:MAG: D-alanyl-D-alanine carboxypeptidase/D-alanyl-D-alanine-endopeptidase [Candidatus Kapabacteria bacterium]|nr:D-alanyl-D-alanine carboxypeptidase/D-alanyl-D-alanine-endopeptidase [Candidatus Kapabacteria bacterium]